MPEAFTVSGAELDYLREALELALGDYEDDYLNQDNHDSPEDWVVFRSWYVGVAGMYARLTGHPFVGPMYEWDGNGPHERARGGQVRAE